MWPVAGSARPCVSRQAALSMSVWFFFSPSFHEHIFSLSSSLSVKSHMLSTHIVTIWSSNICQDTESLPSIKDLPPSHSQSFSLSTWHKLLPCRPLIPCSLRRPLFDLALAITHLSARPSHHFLPPFVSPLSYTRFAVLYSPFTLPPLIPSSLPFPLMPFFNLIFCKTIPHVYL